MPAVIEALCTPVREVWQYRHLLGSLTARELRVRYKQSWLGIGWAVCVPLSMMLIFTFVFTRAVKVVDAMGLDMPYALFAYTGLVPWMFFAAGLNGCVNSLTGNRNLVTKVYFPREVFPLSCVGSALVDFLVASAVLIGLIAYFHMTSDWTFTLHASVLFVPVIVLVQILFMVGVGMVLAMANLFYRDVRQLFALVIQLWMFATNVVYPLPNDGSWAGRLVAVNPMAPIISAYRDCVVRGHLPDASSFGYAVIMALIVFVVGWTLFHRAEFRFAECI
ncbi:MAG: ABC transporter permease [Planctomycetes bacterium]|nr:ABC transporter permease [Planctomycetota bacterium]